MSDTIERLKAALDEVRQAGNREAEVKLLHDLGEAYARSGAPEQALAPLTEAVRITYARRNRRALGESLVRLGRACVALGQHDRASDCFERAVRIGREMNSLELVIPALEGMGQVYRNQGQPERAAEYYEQALEIARGAGDVFSEMGLLIALGELYYQDRRVSRANRYYAMALEAAQMSGSTLSEAEALYGLGITSLDLKRAGEAADSFRQALEAARKAGDRTLEGKVLDGLLTALDALGQVDQMAELCEEKVKFAQEIGDPRLAYTAHRELAATLLKHNRSEQALAHLEQARRLTEFLEDPEAELELLLMIGEAYERAGFPYMVVDTYGELIERARQAGNRVLEMQGLEKLAAVHESTGQHDKAIELLKEAVSLAQVRIDHRLEGVYRHRLGKVYLAAGQPEAARQELERARRALGRAGEKALLQEVEQQLAGMQGQEGGILGRFG